MNFYVLEGSRAKAQVLALTLDADSQEALSAMMAGLVEEVQAADHVEFEHGYKSDDGEVVSLTPFELSGPLAVLTNAADAAVLPALDAESINEADVRAIAAVEWAGNVPAFVAFQRVESRYALRKEPWRLMYADGRFVRDERPGLEIAERVDAVLAGNALDVVSWPKAHSILDLTPWMRQATVGEMEDFFKHKKLRLAEGFNSDALADTVIRRKVASIVDRKLLDKCSVQSLRTYAAKFDVELKISKGRIVLPSTKKEFKAVLALLDEDLLSFDPTGERWLVNSKRRASTQ